MKPFVIGPTISTAPLVLSSFKVVRNHSSFFVAQSHFNAFVCLVPTTISIFQAQICVSMLTFLIHSVFSISPLTKLFKHLDLARL
jgi:hypothetical protein